MTGPWRKRKQGSPALRCFLVKQLQAATNSFLRNTNHETRNTAFMLSCPLLPVVDCQTVAHKCRTGVGVYRCQRTVNRSRWASRRAPFAGNPGKARRIPFLPGKCAKRSVCCGSCFPPDWVPLRPTQNEPMQNERNVLCCVDGAGRSLPLGQRALYIECGSGACQGSLDARK